MNASELGNEELKAELRSAGGRFEDWGKYPTQTFWSPTADFQVHFYCSPEIEEVYYGYDYKVKFNAQPNFGESRAHG
jgi:hypothetical protein